MEAKAVTVAEETMAQKFLGSNTDYEGLAHLFQRRRPQTIIHLAPRLQIKSKIYISAYFCAKLRPTFRSL